MNEGLPQLDAQNPWPGLFPYGEEAQAFFHGRERETIDLLRLVRRDTLTLLYGQSGLGKSSLLRAGLFPRLREEALLPVYLRLDFRNREIGLRQQAWNMVRKALAGAGIDGRAPGDDESLWAYFHAADVELWDPSNRLCTLVLVFDQFEEIVQASEERDLAIRSDAFMEELGDLLENRIPTSITMHLESDAENVASFDFHAQRFRCVIGFREDFLPDLEQAFAAQSLSTGGRLRITKLGEEAALAAVENTGGRLVERTVAQSIVNFVSAATGRSVQRSVEIEPALLSVVCFELNNRRQVQAADCISADLLAGAQDQIIAEFYQRGVSDLGLAVQAFIEHELLTESGYRDSCAVDDAVQRHGIPRDLIQKLVDRRVLRLEERFGVLRVELTHDVLTSVVRERRDRRHEQESLEKARQLEVQRLRRTRLFLGAGGALIGVTSLLLIVFFNLFRQAESEKTRVIESQSTLFLSRANTSLDNNVPGEPIRFLSQAVALDQHNTGAVARMMSLVTQRPFARKVWEKELGQSGDTAGASVTIDSNSYAFSSAGNRWRYVAVVAGEDRPTLRESCVFDQPATQPAWDVAAFEFEATTLSNPVGGSRISDTEVDLTVGAGKQDVHAKFVLHCASPATGSKPGKQGGSLALAVEPGSGAQWMVSGREVHRFNPENGIQDVMPPLGGFGEAIRAMPSPNGKAVVLANESAAVLLTRNENGSPASSYVMKGQLTDSEGSSGDLKGATVIGSTFDDSAELVLLRFSNGVCQLRDTSSLSIRWSRACGTNGVVFVPGRPWIVFYGQPQTTDQVNKSSLGTGGDIELVAVSNGHPIGRIKQSMVANHVAISPDGNHAVVASQDRTAKVYELPTLNPVGSTLLHDGAVVEAFFRLPKGSQVVTASFDGSVRVWDWRQGTLVVEPMMHPGPVLFVRPVMGGPYLLSLADDRRLRLWRVDQREPSTQAVSPLIHQPAISPAGGQLAYLDTDAGELSNGPKVMLAKLSNTPVVSNPLSEKRSIYAAKLPVERLFFSHDGGQLAIAGQGPWLAVVRTSDGVEKRLLQLPAPVERAEFAPRNSLLVLQLADASLRVFDLETGRESGLPIQLGQAILDFGISQDGKWLSVATGAQLQIFDARTGYPVARIAPGGILTAAVHPVRPEIAYASRSGLSFWRPALDPRGVRKDQFKSAQATSKAAREMGSGEGVSIASNKLLVDLRFTQDGNTLAAFSVDGLAWTWNVSTFEQGPFMRHSNSIVAMNLSGDGRWLTTTTLDGIARIWDFRTGQIMTDALSLGDSEREVKIVGTGTWALVRAASETSDAQVPGKPESGHVGYALHMLGLGFDTSPPSWFVPTVAAVVNGGPPELTPSSVDNSQKTASAWWESWLQFAMTKNGVHVK